ncbi:MAG: tail fiber domain-containing protein, partial [Microbacteriaceae bacterium]|nr:tail fiber domain-containing protein [Microbacteriaceae bacterium]
GATLQIVDAGGSGSGTVRIGGATYYGQIQHDTVSTGANIYNSQDSGGHIFQRNGNEQMRLDANSRLLIGTSSTSNNIRLLVQGSPSYNGSVIQLANNGTAPANGDDIGVLQFSDANHTTSARILVQRDGGTWTSNSSMPTRLVFSTTADGASSPTERMRISQNGQVAFTSANTLGLNGGIITANNTSSGSSGVGALVSSIGVSGSANNTNCFHLMGITQGVAYYYLYGNGTSSFTSDARKKKNIETTRDGYLEDLAKLRVVKYNWCNHNDGDPKELGLIAQEVEQVFPGLVQEGGQLEGDDFNCKVLKGSVLPFMLLKALQEATARIETLEAKVVALEAS